MNTLTAFYEQELASSQPVRKLYFELGKTFYHQGNYQKAMEHLTDALQVADGSVEDWKIYNVMYDLCRQTGQPTAAKENLLKLIATAPSHISDELIRKENVDQITIETSLDEKEKEQVLLLQGRAEILKNDGYAASAMELLQQALHAANTVADKDVEKAVLLDMAELYIDEGETAKAAELLNTFSVAACKDVNRRWQLLQGRCYLQQQNTEAAMAAAGAILGEDANYLPADVLKLQALIVDRKYKSALAHVHHLMATHAVNAELVFYKIEILLEGNINIEEGIKLLEELKQQQGIAFIKAMIKEPHIRFRPQHGNDNYFLAQVYKTFKNDFSVQAALQQVDLALQENVQFEGFIYPHGVLYELKASLLEMEEDFEEAARLYYLSGKEFYWNASYKEADAMFAHCYRLEKEKHFKTPLIDNYWYYAECLVQRSYTQIDPYVDESLVKKAAQIWYEAYAIQKPSFNDAWAYLTATLIHEQLAKLPDKQKQEELFYCWFYAEHNLLIDNSNPKAWGFISRAFRGNGLDRNAAVLAQKAYSLNKTDVYIWEEKATTLLNIGQWEEADEFLQKLIDLYEGDVVFKAYKGYALYHLGQFAAAQPIMNEVVTVRQDWMWGRHLRLMVNWMLHDEAEIKKDAEWIWSKRAQPEFKNTTTHEFAYAAYLLGYEKEAVELFAVQQHDTFDELISSLFFYCIYYQLKGDEKLAATYYQKYKQAARHVYNFTELKNAFTALCPHKKDLIEDLQNASISFQQKSTSLMAELHQFADTCSDCKAYGSIGWEAINLSFFRLSLEEEDYKAAFDKCMDFQMAENNAVDSFHLWNRLFLSLKNYFLSKPKLFLQPDVRRTVQTYADASPFNNMESLADLYMILSITGREQGFVSDALSSMAMEIYEQTGAVVSDKREEWLKICAELLPELQLQPAELTRVERPQTTTCLNCGTEVISRTQKFCFSCGARLL